MGRANDYTDNGTVTLREDRSNGLAGVTLQAPADLTAGGGSYTVEMLDSLPGVAEFLQIDAAGKLTTTPTGAGTLDQGYDSGGAGAGRVITADSGPVEAVGDGFQASGATPVYLLETTGLVYNWRIQATAGDKLNIDRGDQDADVSDDTFDNVLTLDGVNRRLGLNNAAPAHLVDLLAASGAAKVRIAAPIGQDASVIFNENSVDVWEVGYDQSAGGLVVGRLSFANPVLIVEDTTGTVRIGDLAGTDTGVVVIDKPDATAVSAMLYLNDDHGGGTLLYAHKTSTSASDSSVAIFDNDRLNTTVAAVRVLNGADGIALDVQGDGVDGSPALNVLMSGGEAAAWFRRTSLSSGGPVVLITDDVGATQGALLIDQNQNSEGLTIDSEATGRVLIDLDAINGNSRGDINFFASRTGDPSAPGEGDLWYASSDQVFGFRADSLTVIAASRWGGHYPEAFTAPISAGVFTASRGHMIAAAETGVTDTIDTINSNPTPRPGERLTLRADSGDTITVSNGTGNIRLNNASNRVLNSVNDVLTLMWTGTQWIEISFSNNTA